MGVAVADYVGDVEVGGGILSRYVWDCLLLNLVILVLSWVLWGYGHAGFQVVEKHLDREYLFISLSYCSLLDETRKKQDTKQTNQKSENNQILHSR